MELKSQTNTFNTGLNLDDGIYAVPNSSYRYAQNIRVITNNDGQTAVLTDMENIYKYNLSQNFAGDVIAVAYGKAYNCNEVYQDVAYVLTLQGDTNYLYEVSEFNSETLLVVVIAYGEWSLANNPQMVFNYETSSLCKLYITDGNSELKVINVKDGYDRYLTAEDISIIGSCVLEPPEITGICQGSIPIGSVQYCYQLFEVHGIESTMSPVSYKIPIFQTSNTLTGIQGLDESSTNTIGVEFTITLHDISDRFGGIRIYRIYYPTSTDDPEIYQINESMFSNSADSEGVIELSFTDSGGNEINQLTLDEFNELTLTNFNTQTICTKDNRLFAANITETTWDIDYDTRSYRANQSGNCTLISNSSYDNLGYQLSAIVNGTRTIPDDHDCINNSNDLLVISGATNSGSYQFDVDGNYGGSGVNVSYGFIWTNLTESSSTTSSTTRPVRMVYQPTNTVSQQSLSFDFGCTVPDISIPTLEMERGLPNYGNPVVCANLLSYQRDEVYRFGAVFYNSKNIATPVHWIGDVRFPAADEPNGDNNSFAPFVFSVDGLDNNTPVSLNKELQSRPLGIVFKFENLPEDVQAVEIVRCRRTESDRSVVTQGSLSKVMLWDNYSANTYDAGEARPFIIPGYAQEHHVCMIGQDEEHSDNDETKLTYETIDNAHDLFDFTSADQCFNKDTDIVFTGDYLVPLYVASSTFEDNVRDVSSTSHYTRLNNGGVQFDPNEAPRSYTTNYTGVVIRAEDASGGSSCSAGDIAISDGLEPWCWYQDHVAHATDQWALPAAVFKYYKFYDRSNASNYGYTENQTRVVKQIQNATIATNIPNTEVVTLLSDIEGQYVDQIGSYTYQNISMGAFGANLGSWSEPSETLRFGIRGVSLLLYCPDMWIGSYSVNGDSDQYYSVGMWGIDDENLSTKCPDMYSDGVYGVQSVLICNVKRVASSRYGGNTYAARTNSVYNIHCGYTYTGGSSSAQVVCYGGDTYLGVLDHAHTTFFYPNDAEDLRPAWFRGYIQTLIPLESSVNVYVRNDEHFLQSVSSLSTSTSGSADTYYMTEVGINDFGSQTVPMYTYNSGYSNTDGAVSDVQKGMYDEDEVEYLNRIVTSDIKTANEITDSWTKFRFADYLDVDNQYGPITNLKEFNSQLFYFQDDALGIAQVNERSLITDENNAQLVLGTGSVLGRYDYVVVHYGDSLKRDKSIIQSTSTMYWFDYDKNILCAYDNQIEELSKMKKVQTRLNELSKEEKSEVISLYDNKYNEVWFRISDSSLIFSEQLGAFTSYYSHTPDFAIRFSDYIATIKDNNIYYIHNIYNIENNDVEDKTCLLQTIINDNYPQTKVYDNVFFDAEFVDISSVTSIVFTTKTQYTDAIDYTVIDNREDTYRFFIPREHIDSEEQQSISMSYPARMRGKYLICDYTFDCNEDKQIQIPFIKTTYRNSLV